MALKIERRSINTDQEKSIIIGLITSDKFIKNIHPIINSNLSLLLTTYARTVANWCIEFYNKYKLAPKKNIQQLYEHKKLDLDENTSEIISELLSGLSENYEREEKYNEDYAIDRAKVYLNDRKLDELVKGIKEARSKNKIEEAEKLIKEYKKVDNPIRETIDVFKDVDKVLTILNEETKGIFQFPGALGQLTGPCDRGDFISFAGPGKRGKTFWLLEISVRCVLDRLRVIYFNLEMTNKQCLVRINQNIAGELKYINNNQTEVIKIPIFEEDEDKPGKYLIKYEEMEKKGMDDKSIKRKIKAMNALIKQGKLKLVSAPSSSMTIEDIDNHITYLSDTENFVPDVIVIDYADYIKSTYKADHRNRIDHIWSGIRKLAAEKHCLVVSATHTNKNTLTRDIKQEDMSEDIRKLNHVSLMIALNQNEKDRIMGVMRCGILASRHDEFLVSKEVIVTQNLSIGKPFLDSRWKHEVSNYVKNK